MATPPQPPNPYGPPAGGNPYGPPAGGNPYAPTPAAGNPYAQPPAAPAAPPSYGYPQQPVPGTVPPQQPMPGALPPQQPMPGGVPPQQPYGYPQPQAVPAPPGPVAPAFGYPNTEPFAGMQGPGGQLTCRFCGGYPAADTTFRQHRGMIAWMVFIRRSGPFCRTCGTASFRELQAKTIVQGWWSWSSWLINWFIIISNIVKLNKINALPEPMAGPGQPMIPGPPVTRRPVMFVFALPVLAFVLVFAALLTSGGSSDTTSTYPIDTGTSAAADPGNGTGGDIPLSSFRTGDCMLVTTDTGGGVTSTADTSVTTSKVDCSTSGAQQVVAVFNGTIDDTKCDSVKGDEDAINSITEDVVVCIGPKR